MEVASFSLGGAVSRFFCDDVFTQGAYRQSVANWPEAQRGSCGGATSP
jgi:hypothetical protein